MFENLSKHVREVHQKHRPSDSNVKCPKCNRSVTKKRLAFHVCGLNSKCLKCGQGFENDASRNDHMIHEHQMEKEHSCHLCGKMFWTSSGVNKHLEAHKELVECSGQGHDLSVDYVTKCSETRYLENCSSVSLTSNTSLSNRH